MKRGEDSDTLAVERDRKEIEAGMTFDDAFKRFCTETQAMLDIHNAPRDGFGAILEIDNGSRYMRIWKRGTINGRLDNGRSAFCFVDKKTGDILKPATWKAPAKGSRGNIFDDTRKDSVGPYGARYL